MMRLGGRAAAWDCRVWIAIRPVAVWQPPPIHAHSLRQLLRIGFLRA